jgi:hypothetical protein
MKKMDKDLIGRMQELETDVGGITSNFLIAADETKPLVIRKRCAEDYLQELPVMMVFCRYDQATMNLYQEAARYLRNLDELR